MWYLFGKLWITVAGFIYHWTNLYMIGIWINKWMCSTPRTIHVPLKRVKRLVWIFVVWHESFYYFFSGLFYQHWDVYPKYQIRTLMYLLLIGNVSRVLNILHSSINIFWFLDTIRMRVWNHYVVPIIKREIFILVTLSTFLQSQSYLVKCYLLFRHRFLKKQVFFLNIRGSCGSFYW